MSTQNKYEIFKFWQSAAFKSGLVLKDILLHNQYVNKLHTLALPCRKCFWTSSASYWNLEPDWNIVCFTVTLNWMLS